MPFLTPETAPTSTVGVVVFIPDNPYSVFTLLGALDILSHPENWQEFGAVTPDEIAKEWAYANDDTATENLNP